MKTITNITHLAFALFAFTCLALSTRALATCQDGCLTNQNTVLGEDAFLNNFDGHDNTAVGFDTLRNNFSAYGNTAVGSDAMYSNATGLYNTATGFQAIYSNYNGLYNTASGAQALYSNNAGNSNVANGYQALYSNTTGFKNTANGYQALYSNTTGTNNTADGQNALSSNTTGQDNIAIGSNAGAGLTTGRHNIDIGNEGFADEFATIRIGKPTKQSNAYIAGISGATVPTGVPVVIDSNGHLGTTTSSARFKDDIRPMNNASDAIFALQPVTFRYKHDLDPAGSPQFGLVAEEVEKVNPDLVARDEQGKPYTVRYEAVNAMLLNEFLKEHRKNEQQRKDFEAALAQQQKQIETLTAVVQKVSAQLELSKSAAQTAANNQ